MLNATVFYPRNVRLNLKDKTLRKMCEFIYSDSHFIASSPLKMVFNETGKTLYCDKQAFNSYLSNEINEKEFIEQTECDELYRNIYEIETKDGTLIDPDSLWKCKNRILTLIDDDFHASFILNEMEFCIAE